MNIFKSPPDTQFTFLNLGAGVQSSCLALMSARGEIGPMPDAAIFADTHAEPDSVYKWLDWLETQLPFPVLRVTSGSLTAESLRNYTKKSGQSGVRRIIPAFGIKPNGSKAITGRACTADYKVAPIVAKCRNLAGIKRGQKEITVTQWIGISWDELQRMKQSNKPWTQHRWPLIERRMTRRDCMEWMKSNGYKEPPRSACVYCPFHSDSEWRRLRDNEPKEFAKAIDFDERLRKAHMDHNPALRMTVYLHRQCKPLSEINFDSDEQSGQATWDFQSECAGMCGV